MTLVTTKTLTHSTVGIYLVPKPDFPHWFAFFTAKKFGATEYVNPKDFDKPIQDVSGPNLKAQRRIFPCFLKKFNSLLFNFWDN